MVYFMYFDSSRTVYRKSLTTGFALGLSWDLPWLKHVFTNDSLVSRRLLSGLELTLWRFSTYFRFELTGGSLCSVLYSFLFLCTAFFSVVKNCQFPILYWRLIRKFTAKLGRVYVWYSGPTIFKRTIAKLVLVAYTAASVYSMPADAHSHPP